MRTAQEIFDTVKQHLLTQNARSENEYTMVCQYRGPKGRKCAVGCLIDDDDYNPLWEGKTVRKLLHCRALPEPLAAEFQRNESLLTSLQHIHDDVDIQEWPSKLHRVAVVHGLQG